MRAKRSFLTLLLTILTGVLFGTAQSAATAARIVTPIDESQLIALTGNLHPMATAANDRGRVNDALPMTGLMLVLSRSAEQQSAFDNYVQGEYDTSSPSYHRWLTPDQVGQNYGPASTDINKITAWLAGKGFLVKGVSSDRMSISFNGTAGQVANAFHTEIHNLQVNGVAHIANMSAPKIPAALAPVVLGVKGLHNFLPHTMHRTGSQVQFSAAQHGWVKVPNSAANPVGALGASTAPTAAKRASSANPLFFFNSGNNTVEEDVSPYDFASIYNLPSSWPSTTNGSGQMITIIGTSDIDLTDVASFKSAFGLPAGTTPIIANGPDGDPGICSGGTNWCNSGDLTENTLDVELSGAVAPGAQVVLVTDAYNSQTNPTNDPLYDGAQWTIDNAYVQNSPVYGARILSLSYGQCELFNGTAGNVAYNNLWETAAASGIAVFAATGDSGSPACDQGGDANGYPYVAQYGLTVSGLASTPYNTAVGGTDFSWCQPTIDVNGNIQGCSASNAASYWNTSNSAQQSSAKGYVPETAWNDTCENPIQAAYLSTVATYFGYNGVATPEQACSFVYTDWNSIYQNSINGFGQTPVVIAPSLDTIGGSGGASNCVVNSTSNTTLGSCDASANNTGSGYGNLALNNDGWVKPSWQVSAAGIGVPQNDGVRDLPDVSFFAGDGALDSASLICVSNDGAPCTNLSLTGSGTNGGAEEVGGTSVATPEMAGVMALINQHAGQPQGNPNAGLYALAEAQNYSGCSAETATNSSSCYFNDPDQGTNAMACDYNGQDLEGGISYVNGGWQTANQYNGQASPNCTISNGDSVGTLTGYSAMTGYDQATGLGSLNVNNVLGGWQSIPVAPDTATVAINLNGVTSISPSQSLGVVVTVSGSGATPTGNVTLTGVDYTTTQALVAGSVNITIPADTFSGCGTVTLTAAYGGDSTYAPNNTSAGVTINGTCLSSSTFTLNTITAPPAVAPGNTTQATATVSSSNGYSGTVSFNCMLTNWPNGAVNLPSCSAGGTATLSNVATSGSVTLYVDTTAPMLAPAGGAKLAKNGNGRGLFRAGGALLALLVFFGIPGRRRGWKIMLGMLVLLATLGGLTACGGGMNSGPMSPGTTAGNYTFTVSATGSPAITGTPTQTFIVTVQ